MKCYCWSGRAAEWSDNRPWDCHCERPLLHYKVVWLIVNVKKKKTLIRVLSSLQITPEDDRLLYNCIHLRFLLSANHLFLLHQTCSNYHTNILYKHLWHCHGQYSLCYLMLLSKYIPLLFFSACYHIINHSKSWWYSILSFYRYWRFIIWRVFHCSFTWGKS